MSNKRAINPDSIFPPFGNYNHGLLLPDRGQLLVTSGQLGISNEGAIPDTVEEQAQLCFRAIEMILAEAGTDFSAVVRLSAFVTERESFPAYMAVRDRFVQTPMPVSTLLVVGGFTREEFLVEVEATAVIAAS